MVQIHAEIFLIDRTYIARWSSWQLVRLMTWRSEVRILPLHPKGYSLHITPSPSLGRSRINPVRVAGIRELFVEMKGNVCRTTQRSRGTAGLSARSAEDISAKLFMGHGHGGLNSGARTARGRSCSRSTNKCGQGQFEGRPPTGAFQGRRQIMYLSSVLFLFAITAQTSAMKYINPI